MREFLESRITSKRIEIWIEPERRRSEPDLGIAPSCTNHSANRLENLLACVR